MRQVPPIILDKLAELRRRERLLMFLWGCAWVFSLFIAVLLIACFVDWLVDLWDETPWALREFMLYGQLAMAGLAVLILVLGPQLRRLRDEMLALHVESKRPELQHRLISALELNRPRARTEGMSPDLLAAMTTEAVHQTRPIDFAALADQSRVKRGSLVFLGVAVVAVGLFLLGPETAMALLRRQLLQDVDIPRSVAVASVDPGIWPSGEEIPLRFKVSGPGVTEDRGGSVRVRVPVGNNDYRTFSVPLSLESAEEDDSAIYVAKVPPGSVDFSYMAKVGDGRTRAPGQVQYVSRPNVIDQKAYLKLHDYAGLNPADALNDLRTNYEQLHPRGDIIGMPGLSARVVVKTQKPIKRAILETHGTPYPNLTGKQTKLAGLTRFQDRANLALANLSGALLAPTPFGRLNALSAANAGLANLPLRRFEQSFPTPTDEVEWRFDLKPTETSYRVTVFDVHGFASKTETVRTIKIEPEPSPTVSLHPETWPADP
ncbi:MAG TPA: hypothetical protein VE988_04800, partial [Gemmataceae bacterium]|nr:hypothetical protein [Gemmataceae bacterium]